MLAAAGETTALLSGGMRELSVGRSRVLHEPYPLTKRSNPVRTKSWALRPD